MRNRLGCAAPEFLSENLTADDYSVLSASNGEEALEVLGRTRPDVLLLDVVLPGISGYEVCRRVRDADRVNDPWDPGIPILMLSAKAESTDRVRGLQRGADDYVTKPSASLFPAGRCGSCSARALRGARSASRPGRENE